VRCWEVSKLSKQVLKTKIKKVSIPFQDYADKGKLKERRIKVRLIGNVRKTFEPHIANTIYFLPFVFQSYLSLIDYVEVRRGDSKSETVGTWRITKQNKSIITLYDKSWIPVQHYSSTFAHELGHQIFSFYRQVCEDKKMANKDVDLENSHPIRDFIKTIKRYKIKPISDYTHDLNQDKTDSVESQIEYANELFAEYMGLTYSRFTDEDETKGSFCNYIKLRNAFWDFVDEVEFDYLRGK